MSLQVVESAPPGGKTRPMSPAMAQEEALRIASLLVGMKFGTVIVTVTNGKVTFLESTHKIRSEEVEPLCVSL